MRTSMAATRRRARLLALAAGAIPLSFCSLASAGQYWNDASSFTWINGSHGGALWPQSSSESVLASFNKSASGNLLTGPSVRMVSPALATASSSATPNLASDLTLEVNLANGDVYVQASTAAAFVGYEIYDASSNLLDSGDPNTDLNERLLSKSGTTSLGNTTTYRNSTNYKLWAVFLDNGSTLAESINNNKFKEGTASTYDTINIPANGTIDFGHIFNSATNVQDLYFDFLEPASTGDPIGGAEYFDSRVSYTGMSTAAPSSYLKNSVTTGNWSTASNWSATSSGGTDNAGPPPPANFVYLTNADAVNRTITLDQNSNVAMLEIGNIGAGSDSLIQDAPYSLSMQIELVGVGTGGIGSHIQSDGTNTYSQALVVGSRSGSIGTYSLSGTGAVTINTFESGTSGLNVGDAGDGTFNQSGGAVTVNGGTNGGSYANLYLGNTATGAGTYLLSNGSLSVAGIEYIGNGGTGTFNQSGGTNIDIGGFAYSGLYVGYGGAGTYDLSGGTLTVGANGSSLEVIGYSAAGSFNQSAGVHDCPSLTVGEHAPGTYMLSGGTLNVGDEEFIGYDSSGTFDQSGGVHTARYLFVGPDYSTSAPVQASGGYLLSGGTLAVSDLSVGSPDQVPAAFTQNGGLLTAIDEGVGGGGVTTFVQTGGTQIIGTTTQPGELGISAGTFSLSGTGSLTVQGNLYVGTGGTLSQSGGTLTASQLITASGGNVQLSGGTFSAQAIQVEELNSGGFGTFTTTNSLALASALAIYLDTASEASASSKQSFVILEATNGGVLSGAFSNIASGQHLTTTDGTASFLVTINGGVDGDVVLSDFEFVPEPGTLSLLGMVGIMMMRRRRVR